MTSVSLRNASSARTPPAPGVSAECLRERITVALTRQGLLSADDGTRSGLGTAATVMPPRAADEKNRARRTQQPAKHEQVTKHSAFLLRHRCAVLDCLPGRQPIEPDNIKLELREVAPRSIEEILYRWWDLLWWSIPAQPAIGRQMRFLLWDTHHESPFALIGLKSPVLNMTPLNSHLQLPRERQNILLNRSSTAHRLGALPPYNQLLGGKMAALSLISDELRLAYKAKYDGRPSLIQSKCIPSDLLFITTTSAFGRSSIYNRLTYKGRKAAQSLGYTSGYGTFHIPDDIYEDIKRHLNITYPSGHLPSTSRKLRLLQKAFRRLDLPNLTQHHIHREFFIFPLAENLDRAIRFGAPPEYNDRPLARLTDYWRERWALPRTARRPEWTQFDASGHFHQMLAQYGLA